MNSQIVTALQQIKVEYGVDIFADARRVKGLLADFLQNEHKGERGLLLQVLDIEVVRRMRQGNTFSEVELRSHAAYFATEYLRPGDAVLSALKCWQEVLSRQKPQSPPTPVQKRTAKKQPTESSQLPGASPLKILRQKAEQGDAEAQFSLGLMYKNGRGVAQDDRQAVAWFQKGADQGYAEAQFSLGLMYKNGRGVAQDDRQVVAWFQKAASQGHVLARHILDRIYKGSLATPSKTNVQAVSIPVQQKPAGQVQPQKPDTNPFVRFHTPLFVGQVQPQKPTPNPLEALRKRADQGNAQAQYNLGLMYANGRGVAKDDGQALAWYQKAADQGHAAAQFDLGKMYENGHGVAKDDVQAVTWYQKAADQGNAVAQVDLGRMYEIGHGVVKDDIQAAEWYEKAADQGYADAQFRLGSMYLMGRGVGLMYLMGRGAKYDIRHAVGWWQKAADQGHAQAQYCLGLMYANGFGVTKDYAQAVTWLQKAANQGHAKARLNLERIEKRRKTWWGRILG